MPWAQSGLSFDSPDETIVSAPFRSPLSGAPVIAIISPVPDSKRVMVLMVSLEQRSKALIEPADEAQTLVVNDDGTVLLSHDTSRILDQNMGPQDEPGVESVAVEKGLAGESGYRQMPMNGTEMAMGYAPIQGAEWTIMTHTPTSQAFALKRDISQSLIAMILVTVAGLGLIGATMGRTTIA